MGTLTLTVQELQKIYTDLIPVARGSMAEGNLSPAERGLIEGVNIDFHLTEADLVKSNLPTVGFEHQGRWYGDFETMRAVYSKGVGLDREDGFDGTIRRDPTEVVTVQYTQDVNWNDVLAPHLESIFAVKRILSSGYTSEGTAWVVETATLKNGETRHYCLTNAHVVDDKFQAEFKYAIELKKTDGQLADEDVFLLGVDHIYDVAVFYFDTFKKYPAIPIDLDASISVDDPVNVVGNQQAYGVRPNPGNIISGESYVGWNMKLFQDNSQALPGNSGSPVFNQDGRVIGMTNSGSEVGGANFNIPLSYVMDSYRQIRAQGVAQHGDDGFNRQHLDTNTLTALGIDTNTYSYGFFVTGFERASVESDSTMRRGDIILKYDGYPVPSLRERDRFMDYLSRLKPGAQIKFLVYRSGQLQEIQFTVQGQTQDQRPTFETDLGFWIQELTPQEFENMDLPQNQQGVGRILSNGSQNYVADVIYRINDTPISSIAEFRAYVDNYKGETFVFFIRSHSGSRLQDQTVTHFNRRYQRQQ